MTSKTALAASAAPRAMFYAPTGPSVMLRGPQVAYAPDDGNAPLSMDQAISALREPPAAAEAAAEPETPAVEDAPAGEPEAIAPEAEEAPETPSEAEPAAEDVLDPETVIEGDEIVEPESDPVTPAIAAPQSWDAAERATFATLPPVAQEIILKRETERDRAVSKAQQESTVARKQAEADLVGLAQIKTTFDEIATRANTVFADKWANVDWVGLAAEDPAAYTLARARYEAEAGELQNVQRAQAEADKVKQQAEQVQFQNYVQDEFVKLSEIAPDLADAKTGPAKRTEVTQFLLGQGISPDSIRQISAVEMSLAHDAMQFRALKAQGKAAAARPAAPATRPNPAPARAAAPSAAPQTRPTPQRNADAAMARLSQTGKMDDAMAVMRARRGAT